MRIGKLFHLTLLVDDLAGPERFFNGIFSPMCTMHGYSAHWHRHAAIYVIAETAIEPMHVLPPEPGDAATSWYRLMERFGPRIHNMAFYVDGSEELRGRLTAAGVRITEGGTASTVFTHPKDTPGMLEFHVPTGEGLPDPRWSPHWPAFRDDYWPRRHPLGLERLSHITVAVRDSSAARDFYVSVLDAVELEERTPSEPGGEARYVLVGEDTVVELLQPGDPSGATGRALQTVGECITGATFKVADLDRAERHLRRLEAPILSIGDHRIEIDRDRTWGAVYRFTDLALAGDSRSRGAGAR